MHLLCTVLCGLGVAQEPVQQTSLVTPAAAIDNLVLPKGTAIGFFLLEPVSSETAKKGQLVRLAVASDVSVNGVVVIPKGTPAEGRVIGAHKGAPGKRAGWVDIQPASLSLMGGEQLHLLEYPPRESGCGWGPCCAQFIMAAPLMPVVFVLYGPFALADANYERKHPSQDVLEGRQMTIPSCRKIFAYTGENMAVRPAAPESAEFVVANAASTLACEQSK